VKFGSRNFKSKHSQSFSQRFCLARHQWTKQGTFTLLLPQTQHHFSTVILFFLFFFAKHACSAHNAGAEMLFVSHQVARVA